MKWARLGWLRSESQQPHSEDLKSRDNCSLRAGAVGSMMWEWGGQFGSWQHLGFGLNLPTPQVGPGREVWQWGSRRGPEAVT